MKIAISIPTYNRKNALEKLLEQVVFEIRDCEHLFKIYIFDNNSNDGTELLFKTKFNQDFFVYSKNERNFGILFNITKAITLPVEDFVLVLPDDVYLKTNGLKRIVNLLNREKPDLVILNRFDEKQTDDRTYSDLKIFYSENFHKITWLGGYIYNSNSFKNRDFYRISNTWFPHIEYTFLNVGNITKISYIYNDFIEKNPDIKDTYVLIDHWYNISTYLDHLMYDYNIDIRQGGYHTFLEYMMDFIQKSIKDNLLKSDDRGKIDLMMNKFRYYSLWMFFKLKKVSILKEMKEKLKITHEKK